MSTASAETRAQYVTRLRILYRPGRSPRTQRNPGDQDRCRAAQRADVPRPTVSERSENRCGDHVCSQAAAARAKDADAVEQDHAVRRVDAARLVNSARSTMSAPGPLTLR